MRQTDEVDELLTRAGARWRADQEAPPEPDLEYMLSGGRKHRRWVPALAAASVAAIAAAALIVLPGSPGQAPASRPPQSVAQGNQAPNDDLLVREGDHVQATGQVIVAPGQQPVFCPPVPRPMPEPPDKLPAPTCPAEYSVTLKGFDPAKLGDTRTVQGVLAGWTRLTGIWNHRTIEIQDQIKISAQSVWGEPSSAPDQVPCPAPAGGWSTKPNDIDKIAVVKFLNARPGQAADPRVLYPNGRAPGAPEVYAIGVAHGDLAAFRREFEKVYDGNLCVHQVKFSRAELTQLATTASNLTANTGLGVWGSAPADVDKVGVSALVYDEALKAALTPIGLDNVQLHTSVQPLR